MVTHDTFVTTTYCLPKVFWNFGGILLVRNCVLGYTRIPENKKLFIQGAPRTKPALPISDDVVFAGPVFKGAVIRLEHSESSLNLFK
jgi:hypothetical protein